MWQTLENKQASKVNSRNSRRWNHESPAVVRDLLKLGVLDWMAKHKRCASHREVPLRPLQDSMLRNHLQHIRHTRYSETSHSILQVGLVYNVCYWLLQGIRQAHEILLAKLGAVGIRGGMLKWLKLCFSYSGIGGIVCIRGIPVKVFFKVQFCLPCVYDLHHWLVVNLQLFGLC